MATASGGRASVVTTNSSSFGQFRLTQFVANAPSSNATQHTPRVISNEHTNEHTQRSPMAPPRCSLSVQAIKRPQPTIAPIGPPSPDHSQASPSLAAFDTLELVERANPLLEGILGPNRDGRVRNPVPSKLKGKTNHKQGNFGVMHMGTSPGKKNEVPGRDAAAKRDAAARRTSENTALRAKAAQQEKYMPPKRMGLENDGHPAANRGSPFAPPREDYKQRARPLAPDETKFEQARLLTLLRSINPVTVVDQICKAVAYFGGIPGAPPPEDGIFPESVNTRETGALFIGWLAEIFPDLSSSALPGVQAGSSGGTKSGGRLSIGDKTTPASEAPNPRNGFGYGQAVSTPAWSTPHADPVDSPHSTSLAPKGDRPLNIGLLGDTEPEHVHSSTPMGQPPEDAQPPTMPTSKRGRGRPKGSRNKGKNDPQSSSELARSSHNEVDEQNRLLVNRQPHDSSKVPGVVRQDTELHSPAYVQKVGDQAVDMRPQQTAPNPEQSRQTSLQRAQAKPPSNTMPAAIDELSPEERAVLEAFRQQDVPEANATTSTADLAQGPVGVGGKRKRSSPKIKDVAIPQNPPPEQVQLSADASSTLPPSSEGSIAVAKDALHWVPVGTPLASIQTMPTAKRQRQRKSKASVVNEPPSRNQTSLRVNSDTPTLAPGTVPDSRTSSSQPTAPVSRPPAEGLEAHYERFSTLPQQLQQQNALSNIPSVTPQHQLRQQQKSAPVPPQSQQTSAQLMQQQKSQQGSRREDENIVQGTSTKSSSTSFYNQRSSHGPSYNQHYPPQPSPLFSRASPQVSTNSDGYRVASTHTLPQTSPQFPQTENQYRTSSPHTISQTAAPFTQSDQNFRSASVHSISQPSPTYAQAENTYRTSSTRPIAQPPASFPRAHTQTQSTHQSHYSHFTDNPYVDLPNLESLGHSGSSNHTGLHLSTSGYGQRIGLGIGESPGRGTNSLCGTGSGLNTIFDTRTNDSLRGTSRPAATTGVYSTNSGSATYDSGTSDQEMREQLLRLRNVGRG